MGRGGFVHLRVHTEFSLIDGLVRVADLLSCVPNRGMNAVAVTDFCNLFSVVKVYKAAIASGVKPIFGGDFFCVDTLHKALRFSVVLLCKNIQGYRNLTRLVSKAYLEGQNSGQPCIQYEWIKIHSEGLIVLSGGREGNIGQALLAGDEDLAHKLAVRWMEDFPQCFYLEIQRTGRKDEDRYNECVVRLANSLQLPLIATNDVRFIDKEDFDAHEARVCIHDGCTLADPRRPKIYTEQQYLRSSSEMCELFHDLPAALANTVEISKRCTVVLELGKNYLPNYPTPNGESIDKYLLDLATNGLLRRLEKIAALEDVKLDTVRLERLNLYQQRLNMELDVINKMGFAGYFLIVADFIRWAKEQDIPVGPGRGSGAGSLVAYALDITDLDPLPYDLLFERFLNPERVSMPDFDIDFCMEGRDRVIEYVTEKYGRQCVSQIITFGTMAAKAVVRDVGRVLGHPYGFVDKLAKLIPFELGMTLTKALEQQEELHKLYQQEEEVKELIDLALSLEGITRNAGKHAGGVVIAPSELTDFTAIYCEQDSEQLVSQFDKDDVEAVGLVKFDFLGLKTLTIIHWALQAINADRTTQKLLPINISALPTDDEATFKFLRTGKTTAIFQLESRGMKDLINRLQPDCFEEIIALVALFRPGPLQSGMVDDFIDRKNGRAKVEYAHPLLEPILKPTYGVILYQEQVMQIAQILANYTLGGADLLRRAMGKKKAEEMAKQRVLFTDGAAANGVEPDVASHIFDLMEKFAGYGFNKSHSAAYALVSYQTAWLKTHYPAAFMAAVMSADLDHTEKVVIFLQECKQMQLKVLPPSINDSIYMFKALDASTIQYGLGAIKGLGAAAIQNIVHERIASGSYQGLFSMCQRLDLRKMNRRVIEILVQSGCLDYWGIERGSLMSSVARAMQLGLRHHQNKNSGQMELFELFEESTIVESYEVCRPWTEKQRLTHEKDTLGFYMSGHPVDPYLRELASFVPQIAALNASTMKKVWVCGLVCNIRRIVTKRGKQLVIIRVEDSSGSLDVVIFEERGAQLSVVDGDIIVVDGELSHDDYSGGLKVNAQGVHTIADVRTRFAKSLKIKLTPSDAQYLSGLQELFRSHRGDCLIQICYVQQEAEAKINLAPSWSVSPSDQLLEKLQDLLTSDQVQLNY